MVNNPPAQIQTRRASKAEKEQADKMATLVTQLTAKRNYYLNHIKTTTEKVNDDATLNGWTKGDISERQKQLEQWCTHLEKVQIDAMCELDDENQSGFNEDLVFLDSLISAKAKLSDRLNVLNNTNQDQVDNASLAEKIQYSKKYSKKPQKRQKLQNNETKRIVCPRGDGEHRIYDCTTFLDMNLVGRLNTVTEYNLCTRCLRNSHNGKCLNKRSNQACSKCLPDVKYHNSLLCPNASQSANAAMKASYANRKR